MVAPFSKTDSTKLMPASTELPLTSHMIAALPLLNWLSTLWTHFAIVHDPFHIAIFLLILPCSLFRLFASAGLVIALKA